MSKLSEVWRRLPLLFSRRDLDRQLEEEIRIHLEMETQENIQAGMQPEEARQAAHRAFGNVALAKEATREVWGFPALESLAQDLRYSLRRIAAQPLYALVIVVTLGLCIGANTAVFNLLDSILLRPLPVPDPDRLVSLYHRNQRVRGRLGTTSYPDYLHYRDNNDALSGLAAFGRMSTLLRTGEQIEKISVELVTPDYFAVLEFVPNQAGPFPQRTTLPRWWS